MTYKCQRGLQIGDAVIESQLDLLVRPRAFRGLVHHGRIARDAVRTQPHQLVVQVAPVGQHHAALARGDDFDRVKTEDRHIREGAAANPRLLVARADGM
jgi:poly-beta-hydroxyalkanoate depolymerase